MARAGDFMRRLVRRITTAPLLAIAAATLLFEELAWEPIHAAVAWLARFRLIARIEAAIVSLPPWGIFTLFVVPAAALLPVKLLAVWLLTTGHELAGIGVLVAAKVTGTAVAARLFTLGQDKLLTIAVFARGYAFVRWLHTWVHERVDRIPGWCALKRRTKALAAGVREQVRRLRRRARGGLLARLAAARNLLARRRPPSDPE